MGGLILFSVMLMSCTFRIFRILPRDFDTKYHFLSQEHEGVAFLGVAEVLAENFL